MVISFVVFFFFQAEDGIRDLTVTGVQTCALPILGGDFRDGRKGGVTLARELVLDHDEVVANKIKYLFRREQRDGFPPGLHLRPRLNRGRYSGSGETKETPKILSGCGSHFFCGTVSHTRERAR